jgi:undecaprenyl diphosphate synthase
MNSYLKRESKKFIESGVKILVSGSLNNIDKEIKERILSLKKATEKNQKITLNVAFDYGSRKEILDAFKKIISNVEDKSKILKLLNEDLISENLYNPEIPDPDLIIRTAGEKRLSNFLLWQSAYSEFYFTKTLWPDFDKESLSLAISDFNKRQRNYGKRTN